MTVLSKSKRKWNILRPNTSAHLLSKFGKSIVYFGNFSFDIFQNLQINYLWIKGC